MKSEDSVYNEGVAVPDTEDMDGLGVTGAEAKDVTSLAALGDGEDIPESDSATSELETGSCCC